MGSHDAGTRGKKESNPRDASSSLSWRSMATVAIVGGVTCVVAFVMARGSLTAFYVVVIVLGAAIGLVFDILSRRRGRSSPWRW